MANKITYGTKTADAAYPVTDASKQWLDEDANEVKAKHNANDDRITVLEGKHPIFILQAKIIIGLIGFAPVSTSYTCAPVSVSAQKITDGTGEEVITITFPTLGTASYQVLVEINSTNSALEDNDVSWCVLNKTTTSFDFSIAGANANEEVDVVISLINLDLT